MCHRQKIINIIIYYVIKATPQIKEDNIICTQLTIDVHSHISSVCNITSIHSTDGATNFEPRFIILRAIHHNTISQVYKYIMCTILCNTQMFILKRNGTKNTPENYSLELSEV